MVSLRQAVRRVVKAGDIERAYSIIENVKVLEGKDEDGNDVVTVTGTATTPTPDRLNDVIDPMGAQYAAEIPLLLYHGNTKPVGRTFLGKAQKKKGIPFKAILPVIREAGLLKDRVDEAIHSLKYRLIGAVSIGFRVLGDAFEFLDNGGILFSAIEILELSLVTIPAHQEALITSVKSMDDAVRAALGIEAQRSIQRTSKATAGASALILRSDGGMAMKIGEQIAAFEAKRAALDAAMEAIMTKAHEDGERTLNTEEATEYDALDADIKSVDEHLGRLRARERAQLATTKAVGLPRSVEEGTAARAVATAAERHVITAGQDLLPKGIEFARYARCLLLSKGNEMMAYEIAKARFPDNPRIANVLKATVAGGTTSDSTWAAPLVDYNTLAAEFIEFLRPQTILGKFGVGGIPSLRNVPFNVRMPRQTSGGEGYWVGQGAPKPLTKFDFDEVTLQWAKVANIAVLTQELIRFSNPSADFITRQALADALRSRLDIDFIDPDKAASANVSPASILNGLTPVVSSGTDADAVRADVQAVMQEFIDANLAPTNGVWIMDTTTALALSLMQNALGQPQFPGLTMNGGTFAGLPVIVSEHVPTDSNGHIIALVNASDVFLADDGQVVIDASTEASLQMLDNPTNNSATGTATSLVSMFQTNSVALRAERWINWQKRRAEAAAYISGVNYSAASA